MTLGDLKEIHDPAVRRVVARSAAADLEKRLVSGLPAYLMGLGVVLIGTPFFHDHPRFVSWLVGAFVAVLAIRWQVGRRPAGSVPALDDPRHRLMRALALVSGALWGTLTTAAVHFYGTGFTSMLLLFLTAGFAAGASSSMSVARRLACFYFVLLVGPPALRGLFSGTTSILDISVPSFFFLAFVVSLSRSNHKVYWSSILDAAVLQQKTAELERARDAAESSSRSRTAFLATVSHELRTPLHGVLGLLRLLADSKLEREQRDHVEMAQRSAGDLLHHINDILDYSKFATKGLEEDIQVGPLDIREVVEDTLDVMTERAAAAGLDLAAFVAPEIPARLRGDAFRLRQVLMNLVSNAVKFTEEGQVVVEVSGTPGVDEEHFQLSLVVTDTGIGMDAEALKGLFNPFSQADSTIARRFGGTGLGLAIVRGLCRAMGGDVSVESAVGVGSRFTCRVTVGAVTASKAQDDAVTTPEIPPRTDAADVEPTLRGQVLVVSPDLPSTGALIQLLREKGLQVDLVATREDIEPWRRALPEAPRLVALFIDEGQLGDVRDSELLRAWLERALATAVIPRLIGLGTVGQKRSCELDAWVTRPVRRSLLARALDPREETGSDGGMSVMGAEGVGLRVLVVDDNAVNRLIALRFLEKLGCQVESASDGAEGLARLERGDDVDIVLMDCQMPGLDGLEVTRRLRAEERERHIPVVALTASAALEDRERCLAAGMDDFLAKPVTFEALAAAIKRWGTKPPLFSRRRAGQAQRSVPS